MGPKKVAAKAGELADDHVAPQSIADMAAAEADALERRTAKSKKDQWVKWLRSGPMTGLGNQHRFTRTATGWMPNRVAARPSAHLSKIDDSSGLTPEELGRLLVGDEGDVAPLSLQDTAEQEALEWGRLWAAGEQLPPLTWPEELGAMPPRPTVQRLRTVLKSFLAGTGLAWDAIHPMALDRLSDRRLEQFIGLFMDAERRGEWPSSMALVTIVLLPKGDGGYRPIGLFPAVIRIWIRMRRDMTREWEVANDRDFIHSGPNRGAHVAAWKQASWAEMATAAKATYCQLCLDLETCCELIDHELLLREAAAVGYPLPLLRMAIAAYRLPRSLSVHGAHSAVVGPQRGITAGSGMATTELKVMLMRLLDRIKLSHPSITITGFVDDISIEAVGTEKSAEDLLVAAGRDTCNGLLDLRLRLSQSGKFVCTASKASVGHRVVEQMDYAGVIYMERV